MKRVVAVVTGREQLEFVEEEIPALGPHDLLIRIDAVGLCHTDLPRFLCQQTYGISPRGYREVQKVVPPCTLGHEPVGTIIDVGSAVTRFAIGDRVTGNVQDVFATHKVVPDDAILLKLPELPFDYRRCIVEPVGCVVNIINHALEDGAKTVGVVGCGVMGLMTIAGLRARGVQQLMGHNATVVIQHHQVPEKEWPADESLHRPWQDCDRVCVCKGRTVPAELGE